MFDVEPGSCDNSDMTRTQWRLQSFACCEFCSFAHHLCILVMFGLSLPQVSLLPVGSSVERSISEPSETSHTKPRLTLNVHCETNPAVAEVPLHPPSARQLKLTYHAKKV